jgi:class III poly(R)-hydroxyalkanoic acid synthase PhaE subunit
MESLNENRWFGGIDSEQIVGAWIENASMIWDSIVKQSMDGEFPNKESAQRNFKAWEPAMKTWNEFAARMNKTDMIENIVEGNKAGTENFHKLLKSGLEGFSIFQKRWMESAKNINSIFKSHQFENMAGTEIFDLFTDIYKQEISKFLSVPPLGLSREYQTKLQQVIDKSNIFHVKLMEFLYFLYIPFEKSFKVVQDSLASLADEGALPEDSKEYYQMWLKQLENHYMALYKSNEYRTALGKVIDAMSDFMSARQQVIQDSMKAFGIPVENDLDELYKDIYTLKKRIRVLERDAEKNK